MVNVLIVDDEESVRLSVRFLADFEKRGITVYEASNGKEARWIMNKNKIHILLTDICMSGEDGVFLMNWVSSHFPETKIITISGYQNFDYILQSMRSGALDYLLKPIDPTRLNELLDKAIESISEKETDEDDIFEQLRSYIEKNYDNDIYLEEIAGKFGFNPSYLSRRFKYKYGESLIEYLTNIRIKKAKEILISSDMKLKDITYRIGYRDEKYFSRLFARHIGISPTEWRKRYKSH